MGSYSSDGCSIVSRSATDRRRSGGAPRGNLNRVLTLAYAKNIEQRVDRRTALGQGLRDHTVAILQLFQVSGGPTPKLEDLDSLEREAVRRLVKRRVVRELAWGRVQDAVQYNDIDSFNDEVPRFQDAVDKEERSEKLLNERLIDYSNRKRRSTETNWTDHV